MTGLEFQFCIRGFHVYKSIWTLFIGKTLLCSRETSNLYDPFAVKVLKTDEIVGLLPKMITSTCSIYLRKGGMITCTINGERRYLRDLTQGGLGMPHPPIFEINNNSMITKINKTLDQYQKHEEELDASAKRIQREIRENDRNETNVEEENLLTIWLSVNEARITIYSSDKEAILRGERLNDILYFLY